MGGKRKRGVRTGKGRVKAADAHVGGRIRLRRSGLGLSQQQLAQALDLSFQQIQKYEAGVNRISPAHLFKIATTLHAPLAYFFEGQGSADPFADLPDTVRTIAQSNEGLALYRAYACLPAQGDVRQRVVDLVKAMSEAY